MKRYVVEIQKLNSRKYVLEDTIEMVIFRIKEFNIPTITDERIESITGSLLSQQKDSAKFPNVIVFLGNEDLPVSIDEFMKQYKEKKK